MFAAIGATGIAGGGYALLHTSGGEAPPFDTGGAALPTEAGQLVITEIMAGGETTADEWFEVYNASAVDLDLNGCELSSGGDPDPIDASTVVAPGERILLARNAEIDCIDAACTAPVAFYYSGGTVGFSNSDPDNLSITCGGTLIDEVNFDWGSFSSDCEDLEAIAPGRCTLSLHPGVLDAASNDDGNSTAGPWYIPPSDDASAQFTNNNGSIALGTPGAANLVADDPIIDSGDSGDSGDTDTGGPVVGEDACTSGQAIFTEFMPSPHDPSYHEWIELRGEIDGGQCNLQGCTVEIVDDEGLTQGVLLIDSPTGELQVAGDAYVLLAESVAAERDAGISWVNADDSTTVTPDYIQWGYFEPSLPSDGSYTMNLVCGDTTVDSAPMSWPDFENQAAGCPPNGCSVNLHPSFENPDDNGDLNHWCIAPADGNTWNYLPPDGITLVFSGTPGGPGDCPALDWPAAGEVVFTEVMPSPAGTNEWFEMTNLAGRPVDLTLCTLRRYRLDEFGAETSVSDDDIGADGVSLTLGTEAVQVFAKSGCILKDDPGAAADTSGDTATVAGACTWGEVSYGSLTFTDGETEYLELSCPTVDLDQTVIDVFSYNTELQFDDQGHSLSFDPTDLPTVPDAAEANDNPDTWCVAGYSQEFCEAGEGECNYGSPGSLAPCTDTPAYPSGSICKCSVATPQATLAPLLAGLLAWARRRKRRG